MTSSGLGKLLYFCLSQFPCLYVSQDHGPLRQVTQVQGPTQPFTECVTHKQVAVSLFQFPLLQNYDLTFRTYPYSVNVGTK